MPVKVLVVDDQASNRDLLTWILEDEGFDYVEADNGEKAVEVFKQHQPDLVLMDVMMPVMDGYEATRQIKALSEGRHVPVIFLTALTDEESLTKCLHVGGDDFFSKPFSEIVLKSKIESHLRLASLTEQIREQNKQLSYLNTHMEQEQQMAEHVFTHALQGCLQDSENIRSYISPVSLFNGDVLMSTYSPSGGLYILLGDFTGHGLPAAMGSIPLSQVFFAMTRKHLSVGMIAREINKVMSSFLPDHMFLAATIVEVDPTGKELSYWAGGMVDGLIADANGKLKEQRLLSTHTPLGVDTDQEFEQHVDILKLDVGDRLYLFTDGIVETHNEADEMYGDERLEALFDGADEPFFDRILSEITRFRGDRTQDDDVSLVELRAQPILLTEDANLSQEYKRAALPWEHRMHLPANEIKQLNPVPALLDMLGELTGRYGHKEFINMVLTELYSNAMEHGVLGLCSSLKDTEEGYLEYYQQRELRRSELTDAYITISLNYVPNAEGGILTIKMEDSGEGFDFQALQAKCDDLAHGRGVNLIDSLCSRLEYSDGGRTVEADYVITGT